MEESCLSYKIAMDAANKCHDSIKPVSIIIAAYNEEVLIRDKILSIIDTEEWIEGSN